MDFANVSDLDLDGPGDEIHGRAADTAWNHTVYFTVFFFS